MVDLIKKTIKNKIDNGFRYILVHKFPKIVPFYLVVEYPKSGGSWLGQMISSYFDIPFPRNVFPKFSRSMVHGHFLPSKMSHHINKIFFLARDGRDVMVSFYYHSLLWHEKNKLDPKYVIYTRNKLQFSDYNDIRTNLPKFIEYSFTHRYSPMFRFNDFGNWTDFNRNWLHYLDRNHGNIIFTKYEYLLEDTEKEFTKLIKMVSEDNNVDNKRISEIVRKFSFENQAQRERGTENTSSFLRKGISGDWKNKFSKEAAEVFDHYAGNMLIQLGYEKDSSWVNKIADE